MEEKEMALSASNVVRLAIQVMARWENEAVMYILRFPPYKDGFRQVARRVQPGL